MRLPDWLDCAAWIVVVLLAAVIAVAKSRPAPPLRTETPRPDRITFARTLCP